MVLQSALLQVYRNHYWCYYYYFMFHILFALSIHDKGYQLGIEEDIIKFLGFVSVTICDKFHVRMISDGMVIVGK